MPKKTAAALGPGKERFALANLSRPPLDFVRRELAKAPAARFEALCFDARRTPLAEVVEWIRALDAVEEDYYIRRVVVLKSRRSFARVDPTLRDRPDITWIATTDPADAAAIYRRRPTEEFEAVLKLLGGK